MRVGPGVETGAMAGGNLATAPQPCSGADGGDGGRLQVFLPSRLQQLQQPGAELAPVESRHSDDGELAENITVITDQWLQ